MAEEYNAPTPIMTEMDTFAIDHLMRDIDADEFRNSAGGRGQLQPVTPTALELFNTSALNAVPSDVIRDEFGLKSITDALPKAKGQYLPNELICHMLKFLETEDLLQFRPTSRTWNELICTSGQIKNLIKFSTETELDEFSSTMNTRIQEDVPFGAYEFNIEIELMRPFLANMGLHITYCVLKIQTPPAIPLLEILNQMPKLEHLELLGLEIKVDWIIIPQGMSKLRSLIIDRGMEEFDSDEEETETVTLDIIQSWIKQTRLHNFECGFPLHLDSPTDFQEFLQSTQNVRTVALKVRFHFGLGSVRSLEQMGSLTQERSNLKLCIDNGEQDGRIVSKWLQVFSRYITLLRIFVPITDIQISPQPRLESLILDVFGSAGPDAHSFLPLHFPSLRRVTIYYAWDAPGIRINFRGTVFNSVDTLYLRGAFDGASEGRESWHTIFPHVKNLRLTDDVITKTELDYFVSHFPSITELNITSMSDYGPFNSLFSEDAVNGRNGWALGGLKGLKKLELVGYNVDLLVGIASLTTSKQIQPLDSLCFFREWSQDESAMGELLFQDTIWHKQVKFCRDYSGGIWAE